MGANFSRIKNWNSGDILTAADLNAEFDNILNNLVPLGLDDYSTNVAQMQVQTDPGEVGSESLATTLAGELARIRFAIAEMKGTSYWYPSATTSLSQLATALGTTLLANRVSSGRQSANSSQAMYLVPDGTASTVTLKGATTPFVYSVRGVQYTISSDVTVTGLTTAPAANNTCAINDAALSGQNYSKLVGENGTVLTVNAMGSSITALTGLVAAFRTSTEYFLAKIDSSTQLSRLTRGAFFGSADTRFDRVAISNAGTITLMKLTWVFAKTNGTLAVTYNNPRYGGTQPTSPAIGDYWFDTINGYWKVYDSSAFVDATATFVGMCIQDTTGCKAARSHDFYKANSDINTVDLVRESTTELRSRYFGSRLNVFGTIVQFDNDFIHWNTATDFASGASLATNTMYYLYVTEGGVSKIDSVAPLDLRGQRSGFYHPSETWRCVGFARTNATGSGEWAEVESFYTSDENTNVTQLTAAVANLLPVPYNVRGKQRTFTLAGGTAFTQSLAPVAQYVGEEFVYIVADSNPSIAKVLQGYNGELIGGSTQAQLYTQGEMIRLRGDQTKWQITGSYIPATVTNGTTGFTFEGWSAYTNFNVMSWREGMHLCARFYLTLTGGGNASTACMVIPYTANTAYMNSVANTTRVGGVIRIANGGFPSTSQGEFPMFVDAASSLIRVYITAGTLGLTSYVQATGASLGFSGNGMEGWFKVPILGWRG